MPLMVGKQKEGRQRLLFPDAGVRKVTTDKLSIERGRRREEERERGNLMHTVVFTKTK